MKKIILTSFITVFCFNVSFAVTNKTVQHLKKGTSEKTITSKKNKEKNVKVSRNLSNKQTEDNQNQTNDKRYDFNAQLKKITQNIDNPKAEKSNLGKFLTVSGLMNADVHYQAKPNFVGKKSTKVSIAQTKLNLDGQAGSWLQAHVGLFYASRSHYYYPNAKTTTGIDLDEIYATLSNFKKMPFYLRVGRQYLPFGRYHRFPILKSLPQQLSETRATAVQIGALSKKGFYSAIYTYNGAARNRHHQRNMNHYGAVLGYEHQHEKVNYDVSVGYLDNMDDVGAIAHNLIHHRYYYRQVGALALNGSVGSGPFDLHIHYVTAVRRFSPMDFAYQTKPGNIKGAKPKAFDINSSYSFKLKDRESRIQIGYDRSYQAYNVNFSKDALHLPKYRFYAIYGIEVFKDTIVALEAARDRDVNKSHGGTHKFNNQLDARLTYLLE